MLVVQGYTLSMAKEVKYNINLFITLKIKHQHTAIDKAEQNSTYFKQGYMTVAVVKFPQFKSIFKNLQEIV